MGIKNTKNGFREHEGCKTYSRGRKASSLCWYCRRAVPSTENPNLACSWSKEFKPVKGWDAVRNDICFSVRNSDGTARHEYTESYLVYRCPRFLPDK